MCSIFKYLLILIFSSFIFGISSISIAQLADAPWPVSRHDVQNTGRSSYLGPQKIERKWTFKTFGLIEGAPTIGTDGTIYVASHDSNLYAFNPDGTLKWTFSTLDIIRGSPAIDQDGTIYVGSYDKCLYAINSDGSLKWVHVADHWIESSPTIGNDGTIYVGVHNGDILAINPDGSLYWKYSTGNECVITVSSPAIGTDGTIYIGCYYDSDQIYPAEGILFAINPDGTLKWYYITSGAIRTSPSIGPDGTIYIGARDGSLYALDPVDGSLLWKFITGDEIRSSTAIGIDGTIYVGSYDHYLYAINPDGTLKWKFLTDGPIESSPAIDSDGTIYIGSWAGYYYAITNDGLLKGKVCYGIYYTSPSIGADETLYGGYDFWIVAIGPSLPSPPYNPDSPTIKIYTDKDSYSSGDVIEIFIKLTNPTKDKSSVELKIWRRTPDGKIVLFDNLPTMVQLPPGVNIIKKIFSYTFDNDDNEGAYMIGARLLNPKTGDYINQDFKIITYSP